MRISNAAQAQAYILTSVVKCCIKMLNATIVLFAWMTFKLDVAVGVCNWFCCKFRIVLSLGMGDDVNDNNALLWSPPTLPTPLWLPSIESAIENSIKFSVKSPFVRVLSIVFDLDLDFDGLTFGMATAFLAADAASDTLPLRWMDAIVGGCWWWWWWSPFTATAAVVGVVVAATVATDCNFARFVPLFVLWLLLLMVLLLLFMIGGWDSVECRPCSKIRKRE